MTPCACSVDDKRCNASDAITMTRCSRGVSCSCPVCPAKSGTALEMTPVSATVGADKPPHFSVANTTTTSTSQAASVGETLSHAGRCNAHKSRIISIGCQTMSQLHATGSQVSHVPRTFLLTVPNRLTFYFVSHCAVPAPSISRVPARHPLDPLDAAEVAVAVATVHAAGATPEVLLSLCTTRFRPTDDRVTQAPCPRTLVPLSRAHMVHIVRACTSHKPMPSSCFAYFF